MDAEERKKGAICCPPYTWRHVHASLTRGLPFSPYYRPINMLTPDTCMLALISNKVLPSEWTYNNTEYLGSLGWDMIVTNRSQNDINAPELLWGENGCHQFTSKRWAVNDAYRWGIDDTDAHGTSWKSTLHWLHYGLSIMNAEDSLSYRDNAPLNFWPEHTVENLYHIFMFIGQSGV